MARAPTEMALTDLDGDIKFSADLNVAVWFHEGTRGTRSLHCPTGDFQAVIVTKTPDGQWFSVGLRYVRR